MTGKEVIPASSIGMLLGLVMMLVPWATPFPASFLGKVLMTMFGFFFIVGTVFLFIASLSVVREQG